MAPLASEGNEVVSMEEYKKAQELANNYKIRAEKAEARKTEAVSSDPELAKTVAALQADKESRELSAKFNKVSSQFLEENPEFEGVADMNVVKSLHANSEETVAEIATRLYGKFVSKDTKGFEQTKGNANESQFNFSGMSPEEIIEVRKDPVTKAAHSKDLLSRLRTKL